MSFMDQTSHAPSSISTYHSPSPPRRPSRNRNTDLTVSSHHGETTKETASTDAATRLAEAIDEFLGDLEKKFRVISDEILGKLDDMAERCDRLETDMLSRVAAVAAPPEPETPGARSSPAASHSTPNGMSSPMESRGRQYHAM